ncbi:hypothetical protein D0T50_06535 [Bacteroides sp. 214]|nr:hypothetical protein [Bacteroides sp. 214]
MNSTDIVKDWGGGVYSAVDQVIVISPTVGSVSVNLTLEGVQATGSFTETVQQNVTSTLFHEIGEFNTPQSDTKRGKVIDYENSVRNVLGLPKRPYDLYHHK